MNTFFKLLSGSKNRLLSLCILICLFSFFFNLETVDIQSTWRRLLDCDPYILAAALITNMVGTVILPVAFQSETLKLLLSSRHLFWKVLVSELALKSVALGAPSYIIAGLKSLMLKAWAVPVNATISAQALWKIISLASALPLFAYPLLSETWDLGMILLFAAAFGWCLTLASLSAVGVLNTILSKATWGKLGDIGEIKPYLIGRLSRFMLASGSLASFWITALSLWLTSVSLGYELDLATALFLRASLMIVFLAPVPAGGIGTREATFYGVLTAIEQDGTQGVHVALVLSIYQIIFAAVGVFASLYLLQRARK